MEIDFMLVNLRMESVYLKELFSIDWVCENGLVNNIDMVVEEYKKIRGLLVGTKTEVETYLQRLHLC